MMTTMAALLGGLPLAFGTRHRLGAAPAAGHHHRRRLDRQPVADPLHHAGGLSLLRPLARTVLARSELAIRIAGAEPACGGLAA